MLQYAGGIHLQVGPKVRAMVSLCWWLRVTGFDPLPLVGSPSRWYRGKLGILGSGPRSSPSLAHCTALPGALTPHCSSAAVPSTTVMFSGRAQKPREGEAGISNWARPRDTGKSAGEGRGSVWRMWVGNERLLMLGHKARIPLTCGQQLHEEQGSPDGDPQGHPRSSACGSPSAHCLPPVSASGSLCVPLPVSLSLAFLFVSLFPSLSVSLFLSLPTSQSLPPSLSFSPPFYPPPFLSFSLPALNPLHFPSSCLSFSLFLPKAHALSL